MTKITKITVGRGASEKFQHGKYGGNQYDNSERSSYHAWEVSGEFTEAEAEKIDTELSKRMDLVSRTDALEAVFDRQQEIQEQYKDKRTREEEDNS